MNENPQAQEQERPSPREPQAQEAGGPFSGAEYQRKKQDMLSVIPKTSLWGAVSKYAWPMTLALFSMAVVGNFRSGGRGESRGEGGEGKGGFRIVSWSAMAAGMVTAATGIYAYYRSRLLHEKVALDYNEQFTLRRLDYEGEAVGRGIAKYFPERTRAVQAAESSAEGWQKKTAQEPPGLQSVSRSA